MNRDLIKWAPFNSVINGTYVKKELKSELNKITKPNLSQEQIMELEQIILNSYNSKQNVIVKFFKNNSINTISGIITKLDGIKKTITINNHFNIYFNNIIDIKEKNT